MKHFWCSWNHGEVALKSQSAETAAFVCLPPSKSNPVLTVCKWIHHPHIVIIIIVICKIIIIAMVITYQHHCRNCHCVENLLVSPFQNHLYRRQDPPKSPKHLRWNWLLYRSVLFQIGSGMFTIELKCGHLSISPRVLFLDWLWPCATVPTTWLQSQLFASYSGQSAVQLDLRIGSTHLHFGKTWRGLETLALTCWTLIAISTSCLISVSLVLNPYI